MRRIGVLVAGVCCAAAFAGIGVGVVVLNHDDGSPGAPPTADVSAVVLGRTVHVEAGTPSTTFLPLGSPPRDGRTLSAPRAYNAMLMSPSLSTPIPADVMAYYGLLTHRFTSSRASHVRVWAFAVESGCVSVHGTPLADEPTPLPSRCRKWEFVDARTGHDLGVITQEVLPV